MAAVGQRMKRRVYVDFLTYDELFEVIEAVGVCFLSYHEVNATFHKKINGSAGREIGLDSHESRSGLDYGEY